MKGLGLGRALLSCAAAMLAGCGGSQAPIGVPWPQGSTSAALNALPRPSNHSMSGSYGDLLYVGTRGSVVLVSYPQGRVVSSFSTGAFSPTLCANADTGDVFVDESSSIQEYAHGGTQPIATLALPSGDVAASCSVDPTSGNLAVAAGINSQDKGGLLIYSGSQGTPRLFTSKKLERPDYPAYDGIGDLFLTGYNNANRLGLYELPNGKSKIIPIPITGFDLNGGIAKAQWDGTYVTIGVSASALYQIAVSGSNGTISNLIRLSDSPSAGAYYWIFDGNVFSASSDAGKKNNIGLGVWSYPSGGSPTSILYGITKGRKDFIGDVTMSVSPSR